MAIDSHWMCWYIHSPSAFSCTKALIIFMIKKYGFLKSTAVAYLFDFSLLAVYTVYTTQSIDQSINLYRAIVQRRVLQCGYAESKRNVLRRILNVLTDGVVRQFSGREFESLGAATEKRRAAVSILCGSIQHVTSACCPSVAETVHRVSQFSAANIRSSSWTF